MRRRLIVKLILIYVLVVAASVALGGWLSAVTVRAFVRSHLEADLASRAAQAAAITGDALKRTDRDALRSLLITVGDHKGMDIALMAVGSDGLVVSVFGDGAAQSSSLTTRPDVRSALGGQAAAITLGEDPVDDGILAASAPVFVNGRVVGAIRATARGQAVDLVVAGLFGRIVLIGLTIGAAAVALGAAMYRHFVGKPLDDIRSSARRFARGDLSHHVGAGDADEFGSIADALNQMAAQLDDKIRTITQQSHERQAVLASMIEGVLAIDTQERVISFNHSAAELLGFDTRQAAGRPIQEVVRNTRLTDMLLQALQTGNAIEADIVLTAETADTPASGPDAAAGTGLRSARGGINMGLGENRCLQASAAVLRDAAGKGIGALIVLNDVTRLRRLESVRRDFVANVSHELKTPVTAIKGFLETLRDGALEDPEDARRFVEIATRQADRLNAIIEDLLRLSRLERDNEESQIELSDHALREVLQSAVSDCASAAAERKVTVRLECPESLRWRVNAPLLEQAVVNLLDNAVKYSGEGTTVTVQASATERELRIDVKDTGVGIAQEHLPRVFERFYRVDKARSRKLGGTGLGLAIVKHIAQAHGGSASVASAVGRGSTFSLHLPASRPMLTPD